jgi:hypothetical protein
MATQVALPNERVKEGGKKRREGRDRARRRLASRWTREQREQLCRRTRRQRQRLRKLRWHPLLNALGIYRLPVFFRHVIQDFWIQ